MFKVIAHRGASADAPDNTAAAFERAISLGSDMIETDVRITADGVLVLEHDGKVSGDVTAEHTLRHLRALNPDLMTVAAALKQFGSRIAFCWEIKAPGAESALVNMVHDLVPPEIWAETEFTSFWIESVAALRRHCPAGTVGWLTRAWNDEGIALTKEWGASQICPPAQMILENPELMEKAHAAGLAVRAWLVRSPDDVPKLAELGVYGGTCNWPGPALAALGRRE